MKFYKNILYKMKNHKCVIEREKVIWQALGLNDKDSQIE